MTTISNFVERFHLWMDKRKCTGGTVYIRSAISSEEEAVEFIKTFSATTGTDWVLHHGRPHSQKYIFSKTWVCHQSWDKKIESSPPDAGCSAKIDILLKKTSPSAVKSDPYLNHNPPLHCVIRLTGEHNHNTVDNKGFQMVGLTAELKEKFFEYFQLGLSASEARSQHEIVIHTMKSEKNILKRSSNLTGRQAQHLYNHWEHLKDTIGFSEENTESTVKFTIKDILKTIPKKLPKITQMPSVEQNANFFSDDNGLQPPLMFVCTDSTGDSPSTDGHLLYNLKYGLHQTVVSRCTIPEISLVRIESQTNWGKHVLNATSIPAVSVKLEPPDSDDEAENAIYPSSGNSRDTSMMPIISKAENASSLNLYLANDIAGADSCLFPLVFSSTGMTTSMYEKDAPLLYSLNYGPQGLLVTPRSTPNILAVQIPSTSQATVNIKNAFSNTEVTVDSHVQVEHIKREIEDFAPVDPPLVTNVASLPVILDVSSCKKRKRNASVKTHKKSSSNGCASPKIPPSNHSHVESLKQPELKDDEDYQFLMSLLPDLKQIPTDQKTQVKKKMQEFVLTNRLCSSRIKFENSRSNIYRDCGVLPSLRDWKF